MNNYVDIVETLLIVRLQSCKFGICLQEMNSKIG